MSTWRTHNKARASHARRHPFHPSAAVFEPESRDEEKTPGRLCSLEMEKFRQENARIVMFVLRNALRYITKRDYLRMDEGGITGYWGGE